MGDASRKRLLIAAAAVAALMLGLGAAAEAGLLSRGESSDSSGRGAALAIADPSGNGEDVVAVGETTAEWNGEEAHSSVVVLRVGETKIGEHPHELYDAIHNPLENSPLNDVVDIGCDDDGSSATQSCLEILPTSQESFTGDGFGSAYGYFAAAQGYTPVTGDFVVLGSVAEANDCYAFGSGVLLAVEELPPPLDLSQSATNNCAS